MGSCQSLTFVLLLIITMAATLRFTCKTGQKVCEINNITITESTDVSSWEFPNHHNLAFGSYPMPDDTTQITTINQQMAHKLANVQTLKIQNVSLSSFCLWKHLQKLDASHNHLAEIIVVPLMQYNLKSLNLQHNHIHHVNFLQSFHKLRDLDLRHNNLEFLDMSILHSARYLTTLKLSYNHIKTITTTSPETLNLPLLTILMLNNNQLTILDASRWNFNALQKLFLSNNRLRYISMTEIKSAFSRLQNLYLDGNDWECPHLNSTVAQLHQSGIKLINYSKHDCAEGVVESICCAQDKNQL